MLLYDTVPGGTGYLKDRMTDPGKLRSIFEAGHAALCECACIEDPEKDGCYRCVFAYRRSRDMPTTSRKVAERLVAATLKRWSELEVVEGLTGVAANVLTESELEERFIEALRQRAANPLADGSGSPVGSESASGSGLAEAPAVEIRSAPVKGKPGYILSVGGNKYRVEPQADFDLGDGVAIPSRPDFAIWPDSTQGTGPPPDAPAVAVFLDGFEYHRDQTGDDSAKRMSLARAGVLAWSLTWDDLEGRLRWRSQRAELHGDHGTDPDRRPRRPGRQVGRAVGHAEVAVAADRALVRPAPALPGQPGSREVAAGRIRRDARSLRSGADDQSRLARSLRRRGKRRLARPSAGSRGRSCAARRGRRLRTVGLGGDRRRARGGP